MPGFELLGEEEKNQILDVLSRGVLFRYEFGEKRKGVYKVEEFEKAFSQRTGAAHALAVSSGTAALRVALAALGIGPGDEVITQGFTFVATWESILDCGAEPVFTEIDDTLCMDPADLEKKITPRTKAIIPVHMLGGMADIEPIVEIACNRGLSVIEDTAQACGGTLKGKALGAFGSCGTFSFDSVKTITTGEGGMIITDDEGLYVNASEYHDHGHDHDPKVGRGLEKRRFIGMNYRMMELQGALGLAQLAKLDEILRLQRANKAALRQALEQIPGVSFRRLPDPAGDTATFLAFSLPTEDQAKKFNRALAEEDCGAVYFFDNTWHYYRHWEHLLEGKSVIGSAWPFRNPDGSQRLSYSREGLPKSDEIMRKTLVIPINNHMENDIPKLRDAIAKAGSAVG
jgi:8-amino-3,8-dideoxy-alpha-D-manno-octulosonate transaminase